MRRPYEQLGPDTTSGQITGDDTPSANRMEGGRSGSAFLTRPPALPLPKGGGAIRGIGEKFTANPVTGTGTVSVPIAVSPGRNGFGPQLSLTYDSGAGNGPFGLGWNLNLPSITRKTDKGLPRYLDHEESDVFILAGAEDLVPNLGSTGQREADHRVAVYGSDYHVRCYRPRIEGLFALIERWTADKPPGNTFWRTISRDNVTTWFGRTANSRIYNPDEPSRVFQWLICESYDDKGNVAVYHYVAEDANGVERSALAEANRRDSHRTANRYLKYIRYGHYLRRIKSVSVSIPCVVGPYASVNCKLTLVKSEVRHERTASEVRHERTAAEGTAAENTYPRSTTVDDPRFTDYFGASEAIVTSTGNGDSGLFETQLRDERFLPFEGSGVISTWRLELPGEYPQFDYSTISDVVLSIRYTARDGGDTLREAATNAISTQLSSTEKPLCMLSCRSDFPTEWARAVTTGSALEIPITRDLLPYWMDAARVNRDKLEIREVTYAKLEKEQTSPLKFVPANWPVKTNAVTLVNLGEPKVNGNVVADVIVLLSIGK